MAGQAPELPRNLAGRQLGRYEVLTQLASGGMAAVYVARALGVAGFERLVAIKVLHPHLAYEEEFISMFLDEARLAARIRHPNVVPTLDISDTEGDGFFLVMEFIEGDHFGSLLGMAARGGKRLGAQVVSRVVLDALGGLSAAHRLKDERGQPLRLVHRDVSPHNVMVGADGIGRLTDFGVAKAEKRLSSTRAGQFKGKLAYMANEQAATGFADQRSDLFSMGIILWEALTGRRLFRGENNAATLNKILQERILAPSELWPDLEPYDEVLAKALDRDPEKRFQSADDMAAALEEAARADQGVASAREVAATVAHWLGEKLEAQRERVRESIDRLGRSDYSEAAIPVPMESSASAMRGRPMLVPSSELTAAEVSEARPDHKRLMIGAAVVAAISIVGILLLLFSGGEPQTVPHAASSPVSTATTAEGLEPAAEEAVPAVAEAPREEVVEDEVEPEVQAADEPGLERPQVTRMGGRRGGSMHQAAGMEPLTMEAVTAAVMEPETASMHEPAMDAPSMMRSVADDVVFNPYRQ